MKPVTISVVRHSIDRGWPTAAATITVEDRAFDVFFRSSHGSLFEGVETFIPPALLAAMKIGAPLELSQPISLRLLDHLPVYQSIVHTWFPDFKMTPVLATARPGRLAEPSRAVGCFFSGGADSFYTVLQHQDEITHLVFLHGYDLPLARTAVRQKASAGLHSAAADLGKTLIEVETNVRELFDAYCDWGRQSHGAFMGAVAMLLAPQLRKIYIAPSASYDRIVPWGSHPLLDPLWSTEDIDVIYKGGMESRLERARIVSQSDVAMRWLRVCFENPGDAYNCGVCVKCVHTMIRLYLVGALERCATLPHTLDYKLIADLPGTGDGGRLALRALLDIKESGRHPELEQALRTRLLRAGVDPDPSEVKPAQPLLYARPETRRRLESPDGAKVVLTGSFSTTEDMGDLANLRSVLGWHRQRDGDATISPLCRLLCVSGKDDVSRLSQLAGTDDWIFYEPPGMGRLKAADLGLEQVTGNIQGAVTLHVCGGDTLNTDSGQKMMNLVESLLARMAPQYYVLSDVQVSPDYVSTLAQHCRAYQPDLVGCRDAASAEMLSGYGVPAPLAAQAPAAGIARLQPGPPPPGPANLQPGPPTAGIARLQPGPPPPGPANLQPGSPAPGPAGPEPGPAAESSWQRNLADILSAPPDVTRLAARSNAALEYLRHGPPASTERVVEAQMQQVLSSHSWRMTAPLRGLKKAASQLRWDLRKMLRR